ncbi:mitochondrial carrier domain-containing protein [Endogone sp. FLAS-F59071]|nr:mitochondrial carrier domain-containing protein [Endogone sp. FLAS-F59071]|eukprot:RUS13260.1 mitochondrial carrier domain-containing protein [Endogone sp. FLAS-F59071]
MMQAFRTILREEGISRGLYSGITPAISGSIPATTLYFGTYEFTKRNLITKEVGCPDTIAHLIAGSIGDVAASIVYVPSEVLKTRMQLQGRYNNPHFISGYNYRNTWHAAKMIVQYDGFGSLYHGYKATLLRDVPFSALQFAFYEKFKQLATLYWAVPGDPLTLGAEIVCGSFAGGIAGAMTTPLDVVKTLLQTQQKRKKSMSTTSSSSAGSKPITSSKAVVVASPTTTTSATPLQPKYYTGIVDGLLWNYRHQGLGGLFRGLGPRVFWTSLQSAAMFVIYEQALSLQEHMRTLNEKPYSS